MSEGEPIDLFEPDEKEIDYTDPFANIYNLLNQTDRDIQNAKKELDSFIEYITTTNIFEEPREFYKRLYHIQSMFSTLLVYIQDMERYIYELQSKATLKPVEEKNKTKRKRSFLDRLLRREKQIREVKTTTLMPTIERAYSILEEIKRVYEQYLYHRALIQIQDTPEDRERLELSLEEFVNQLTRICGEAKIYIISSLERKKREIEHLLSKVSEAIIKLE